MSWVVLCFNISVSNFVTNGPVTGGALSRWTRPPPPPFSRRTDAVHWRFQRILGLIQSIVYVVDLRVVAE